MQAPVKANGKIRFYNLSINQNNEKFESHNITADNLSQMYSMELPAGKMASIEITAYNSAGESPKATLSIPRSDKGMLRTAVVLSLKALFCPLISCAPFLIKNVL